MGWFMKLSRVYASLVCALTLTACGGGGGSSSDNSSGGPATTAIKIIDGYLSGAVVCVDRNINSVCDSGEEVGSTNSNGVIAINNDDLKYPLIAKIITGTTTDSGSGAITQSYELIAPANSTVVTPFTTAAVTSGKTLVQLAQELNMPADVISGDYVASTNTEASHVYALARSLVKTLPETLDKINETELTHNLTSINQYITDNPDEDLNSVDIVSDGNGSYTTEPIQNLDVPLSQYVLSNNSTQGWSFGSLNKTMLHQDLGLQFVKFNGTAKTVSYTKEDNSISTFNYITNDVTNTITQTNVAVPSEIFTGQFIYKSQEIALIKDPASKEGLLLLKDSEHPTSFSVADVAGKTFYLIRDQSESQSIQPLEEEFTFHADGTASDPLVNSNINLTWKITHNNEFNVDCIEIDGDGKPIVLMNTIKNNQGLMVIADVNNPQTDLSFGLVTQSKTLADLIMSKWNN